MAEKKKNASTPKTSKNSSKASKKGSAAKAGSKKAAEKQTNPQRFALLYLVIAAFLLCLIIIRGQNIWSALRGFVFGVFGFSSLLLPVFFGYLTYLALRGQKVRFKGAKAWLAGGIIFAVDILLFLLDKDSTVQQGYLDTLGYLYKTSYAATGPLSCNGGVISGVLGYPLMNACGKQAAIAVTVILLLALILLITGISLADVFRVAKKPVDAVAGHISKARENARRRSEKYNSEEEEFYRSYEPSNAEPAKASKSPYNGERIDITLDETQNSKKKGGVNSPEVEFIPEDDGNAADLNAEDRLNNALNNSEEKPAQEERYEQQLFENIPIQEYKPRSAKKKQSVELVDDIDDGVFKVPKEEKTQEQLLHEKPYSFPPVQLLKLPPEQDGAGAMNELQSNATKLINTLKSFGVGANIVNICRGPSVTRYELQPAPGVKISKITNLADDIALNLAADGVRIEAPIPGKAAVGIEVPNKMVTMVSMRELIDSDEFRNGKSKLTSVLGKDISGNIVSTDLAAMPHLLIAGTTGSGKSVCVNSILLSILYKARPDEVKLLLIDPKMVEFSKYKGIPHLLVPVVSDAKKAAGALNWAVSEMLQRYRQFSEYDCKNIHSFNELVEENLRYIRKHSEDENACMELNGLPVPKEKMPQIVIAIDELADLMMAAPSEVEESICRLAQMARAAGMHLVIATQRPSVNVITGVIKANIPSRISLKVSSQIDSRTILDFGGAEKLIGRGDMLFSPVGAPKPLRVQGCYASDEEIESVTKYIKEKYNAQYNSEIEEKIRKIAAEDINAGKGNKGDTQEAEAESELDSKMEEAIRCVIEAGQASTSMLQRRIKVGYARAGRMIDDMEQMGIVGPYQGSKPREVLMTYNEWLERNNVLGDDLAGDE